LSEPRPAAIQAKLDEMLRAPEKAREQFILIDRR
jgi:low affinity Fe/Cu permease